MTQTGSWDNQDLLIVRVQELYTAAHEGRIHTLFEVTYVDDWYQIEFGEEGVRLHHDGTIHLRSTTRYVPVLTAGPYGATNMITLLAILQLIATASGVVLSGPPDATPLTRNLERRGFLGDHV